MLKVEPITSPTGSTSSLPYLIANNNNLYLSWVEQQSGTTTLFYAKWNEKAWSSPEKITEGNDWFVNWADYPMISIHKNGNQLAHFLAKNAEGTYSYNVNLIYKPDSTTNWGTPFIPHTDQTPTEHGFVTMIPLPGDTFQVAWLDGRNTGSSGHGGHEGHGAMTLRAAIVDNNGDIKEESLLDDRVCDCCQTAGALTKTGPVIVYRDRSALEIRDMSIVRKVNGEWTKPKTINQDNWKIAGCPVNGPRIAAKNNALVVAWYTASNNQPEVKVIFSEDGGDTFGQAISIDNQLPLGRVDVVMVTESRAVVSWLAKEKDGTYIKALEVESNGTSGEPIIVSKTSESRDSGFPQMEIHNGSLFFAWKSESDQKVYLAKRRLE